jgi:hypothetical protein
MAAAFGADSALRCGDDSLVSIPIIRVKACLPLIQRRYPIPQLAGRATTAVADLECDDLPGLYVYGNPYPLLVLLARDKTPHLIGFCLQTQEFNSEARVLGQLHIEIIRQRFIKLGDEGQQPAEAYVHHAADGKQREAFEEQSLVRGAIA